MKYILKKEKKILQLSVVLVAFLIMVDEIIKYVIYSFDNGAIDNCEGSSSIIHYHPVFNEKGSFLNLKLDMEYHYILFLGITLLGILFSMFLFFYLLKARQIHKCHYGIMVPAIFFLAACVGRLIERFFWQYTLDYIAIRKIGIMDLVDLYLVIGCIGLFGVACYVQSLENKLKKVVVGK